MKNDKADITITPYDEEVFKRVPPEGASMDEIFAFSSWLRQNYFKQNDKGLPKFEDLPAVDDDL